MVVPALELIVQDCYPWAGEAHEAPGQLPWIQWFEGWLHCIWPQVPQVWRSSAYEVSVRLSSDEEIQALNAQYRGIDRPTDVLAFAALESETIVTPGFDLDPDNNSEPLYLGDLIIAIPTAQRQAQEFGHSLRVELAWLAAHGFLHLWGWDHADQPSLVAMVQEQLRLLQAVKEPWPLDWLKTYQIPLDPP